MVAHTWQGHWSFGDWNPRETHSEYTCVIDTLASQNNTHYSVWGIWVVVFPLRCLGTTEAAWPGLCLWPARPPPCGLPPAHTGQNTQHRPEVTHFQERTLSLKSEVPYPDHDGESNQASLTPHLTPVVHPLPSLTLPFPDPSDTADTLFGFTDFISLGK